MNRGNGSEDVMVDDDYAPERYMSAVDDESAFDPPSDPPIVPGGDDGAEVPDDLEDEDDDEGQTTRGPITDAEITARVRRLLRADAATSMLSIHVSTEDGVVTLRGTVQTLDDTDNAAEVASRVDGVLDVLDEIEVE